MTDVDSGRRSNVMTKEEEQDMDAMRATRSRLRSGSFRFESNDQSSGTSEPTSAQPNSTSHIRQHSSRLRIGYADTRGKRGSMEDEIAIVGRLRNRDEEDFVAVYDGHGGKDVSMFAAKMLHQHLIKHLDKTEDPVESLRQAFIATHDEIKTQNITGGTTALVSLFVQDKCYVANLGDSRAVLSTNNGEITKRISTDHKPHLPEEEQRVTAQGGFVTKQSNRNGQTVSRVNGLLAVSRALGDTFLDKFVSHEPDVIEVELREGEQNVLILACDGLWDVVSDEEATKLIADMDSPEQAAVTLRNTALSKGSTDNISVVIIFIPTLPKKNPTTQSSSSITTLKATATTTTTITTDTTTTTASFSSSVKEHNTTTTTTPTKRTSKQNNSKNIAAATTANTTTTTTTQSTDPSNSQKDVSTTAVASGVGEDDSSSINNNNQDSKTFQKPKSDQSMWNTIAPVAIGGISAILIGIASFFLVNKRY